MFLATPNRRFVAVQTFTFKSSLWRGFKVFT